MHQIVPAMLLTMGAYYGTLAAARCLGRQGICVVLADDRKLTATGFSRFIRRFVRAPSVDDPETFRRWMLEYGEKNPGLVLYPTSDELAWIIATEQTALRKHYKLFQSPESAVYGLLNKQRLYSSAREFGLQAPLTHFPSSTAELDQLAREVTYPVIVKPRTQIGMRINVKGLICNDARELKENVALVMQRFPYKPEMLAYDPTVRWPMVQQFHPEAASDTYSLTGFRHHDGKMVVRGAKKVLQRPIRVGVGMAFESRPIQEHLRDNVQRLLQSIGYAGVFEAEFIHLRDRNEYLLMDFNPRFYGQMGFDAKRGLPLPLLVFAAANGDEAQVQALMARASDWDHQAVHKYRYGWMLNVVLTTQWLGRKLTRGTRARWLQWSRHGRVYDSVFDSEDRKPYLIEIVCALLDFMKHPRSSFRTYFR